jgi:hypothetical protein
MEIFDLGLAYVWEYDDGLIELIERTLQGAGITTFVLSYHNFPEIQEKIANRKLGFNFYLDRAWDVDEGFEKLGQIINRRKTIIFNPYKKVLHAIDKASMHLEFMTAGLNVPYSIIIPPHSEIENIVITIEELEILGRPFIIKPCNTTGGGVGVVTGAESLREVLDERLTNTDDKYILQEKIYPRMLDGKRAWFRSFWAFGKPIPVWWDDQTHLYEELKPEEIEIFGLRKLFNITRQIAGITGLDFFSTEIVLTNDNKFIVIDYVNDQCDMRLKSKHMDGVPDSVGYQIVKSMLRTILREKKKAKI